MFVPSMSLIMSCSTLFNQKLKSNRDPGDPVSFRTTFSVSFFFFFSLPFIWKLTTACATVLDQILFKRVVGFFFLHGTSVACSIVPENRQLTQRPHDHDVCLLPPPLATSEINVTFSFLCSLSQLREHVFVGRQFCQETRVNYSFPGATKRFQVDLRQSPYSIVYIPNQVPNILSALPLPHVSTLLFLRKRGI